MLQFALALFLLITTQVKVSLPEYLQEITVSVEGTNGSGSGVIKRRGNDVYVLTVAHVVAGLKIKPKKYAEQEMCQRQEEDLGFRDTYVVKELYFDGMMVGQLFFKAKVVRYSQYEDLALLRLYKNSSLIKFSAVFASKDIRYRVGSHLWHCGCFFGPHGINSISDGILSYVGRLEGCKQRDQSSAPIYPGSSGGGVYNDKGVCLGVVINRLEASDNYFIPMRQVMVWAKRVGVDFVFDDALREPRRKELKKWAVEDKIEEDLLDLILRILK